MPSVFESMKISDYFDLNDKEVKQILKNAGISHYFSEDSVKSIFAMYLMGAKEMPPSYITNSDVVDALANKSAEEKKALGQAFLNDMKEHKILGEVEGGKEKVEENIRWFGQMYSKASESISLGSDRFPKLDDLMDAESICNQKDTSFVATGMIASDFLLETGITFSRRSNRATKQNNYGIDFGKVFLEGYGGVDKYNKDANRMKSAAVVSTYIKKVADATEAGDNAEAIAAFTAVQMACKYREDTVLEHVEQTVKEETAVALGKDANNEELFEEKYNAKINEVYEDISSVDADSLLGDKMVVAAEQSYISYKTLFEKTFKNNPNKINKFEPLLKNEDIGDKEGIVYNKIIDIVINNTKYEIVNRNPSDASSSIGTINMNNNSDVYSVLKYEGPDDEIADANLPKTAIDIDGVTKDRLLKEAEIFDNIFAPLIDSESVNMKRAGDTDLFKNFKVDGLSVSDHTKQLKNIPQGGIELYNKHIVLCAMASKTLKLTYSPYKLSAENWEKTVVSDKNIEIKRPANLSRAPYNELEGFDKNISDIVQKYEDLKLVKSFFHIDRKLYKNVIASLEQLKTTTENLAEKDKFGATIVSDKNWNKVLEQYNNVAEHLEKYIEKREGAKSPLGKKRLAKIKALYKDIDNLRGRMVKYVKDPSEPSRAESYIYMEGRQCINGQDESIDWSKFERASVDNEFIENYEYVNENEYTNAMKELYIPVKTEDEKNANPLPKKVNIKDKIKQAAGKANAVKNPPVKEVPKKAADAKKTRAEMIAKIKKNAKTNAKNNAQKK